MLTPYCYTFPIKIKGGYFRKYLKVREFRPLIIDLLQMKLTSEPRIKYWDLEIPEELGSGLIIDKVEIVSDTDCYRLVVHLELVTNSNRIYEQDSKIKLFKHLCNSHVLEDLIHKINVKVKGKQYSIIPEYRDREFI